MAKTPEEKKQYLREYNQKNRDRLRLLKREYYLRNKEYLDQKKDEHRKQVWASLTEEEKEVRRARQREATARCYQKYKERYQAAGQEYMRQVRAANPEAAREYHKAYRAENKKQISERQKTYRTEIAPEKERQRAGMRFAPGQTIAGMKTEQNNKCGICRKELVEGKDTHVDHSHEGLGYVRGLLCHKCNLGIGHLNDSIELLQSAVAYLEQHKARIAALEEN